MDLTDGVWLCVLASGSGGNCSVVSIVRGGVRRLCLIDVGLSPRRTNRLLAGLGLGFHQIDDVILTHLDSDHFYHSWVGLLPRHATLRLHRRHSESPGARGMFGLFGVRAESFEEGCRLRDGTLVRVAMGSHDQSGTSVLRFEFEGLGGSLGFATDLGRFTPALAQHLRGVDVLAIESNYCPVMQESSGRPLQLQRRIMGGSGHLSNQEARDAVAQVSPASHVVLLHLSRECNDPALARGLHEGAAYGLTVTSQFEPTGWVAVGAPAPAGVGDPVGVRVGV
ncbi:MAG: MBL fold metallo-hydrolase [Phycisphaeraceae bacterium]|nr:MBL fold metallo-hydrolase [Phycisphaeraceae bacterium]